MSESENPISATPSPNSSPASGGGAKGSVWQPTRPAFFVVAVLAIILLITTFVEMGMAGAARADAARGVQIAQENAAKQVKDGQQAGLSRTAAAIAASIQPVMALKQQVPEITDRTLQAVCQGLLQDRKYRFVAITDAQGVVVASSDLALVGKPLSGGAPTAGALEAMSRIGTSETNLGTVTLRMEP